jgi:hypothetical protein
MVSPTSLKAAPPDLPVTVNELLKHRLLTTARSLNDTVEEVVVALYEHDDFRAFINAVYDEQAVEGSLAADNIMAAEMIRAKATKLGYVELSKEKLATIAKALGVILRRYGYSRKDRRNTVGGQVVEGNGD